MTDKHTLDLAREWAADIDAGHQPLSQDAIDAAADTINALPDSWVDAAELRDLVERIRDNVDELDDDLAQQWQYGHLLRKVVAGLEGMLPTRHPAHECADDVLHLVIHEGAVRTAWRVDNDEKPWIVDNDEKPWIVSIGHPLGATWATDEAVSVLGLAVPDDGVVDRPAVSDDADGLTGLREARAEQDDAPELDPAHAYRDRDGDTWSYYRPNRAWACKDTSGGIVRVDPAPPAKYGPYPRIEGAK